MSLSWKKPAAPGRARTCVAILAFLLTVVSVASADQIAQPPAPRELTIAAVGDIMLGGTAGMELVKLGYDYPFVHVGDLLRAADLTFGNLEGPLTRRGDAQRKKYVFRSPPELVAPALARAGFDMVSLANNHSLDYGIEGLRDTLQALEQAGVRHAGAGENLAAARRPAFLEAAGKRIAVLAYSLTFPEESWASDTQPGTAFGHEHHVRADVAAARKKADIVLVSFHWGQEGSSDPRPYQRQLGRAAIDAGAAAVVGHHPHVLQGIEHYKDGVILYSLGNFVFGSYSPDAKRSAIAVLVLQDGRVRELKLYPIDVNNFEVVFQPRLLTGPEADAVIKQVQELSQPLGAKIESRDGVAVLSLPKGGK
jgi:poly-gamma-glutamate synthesis protein (capsule biosynthesis protein)